MSVNHSCYCLSKTDTEFEEQHSNMKISHHLNESPKESLHMLQPVYCEGKMLVRRCWKDSAKLFSKIAILRVRLRFAKLWGPQWRSSPPYVSRYVSAITRVNRNAQGQKRRTLKVAVCMRHYIYKSSLLEKPMPKTFNPCGTSICRLMQYAYIHICNVRI